MGHFRRFRVFQLGRRRPDGQSPPSIFQRLARARNLGRVTFVAVTKIEPAEYEALLTQLSQHFVNIYGAPNLEAARPVAADELSHMAELCAGHEPNTLLTVARELTDSGVAEAYRVIEAPDASLDILAVHGELE